MFLAAHEWSSPQTVFLTPETGGLARLYQRLSDEFGDTLLAKEAAAFLEEQISRLHLLPCDLPDDPEDLEAWMSDSAQSATSRYAQYLHERQAGGPRRFFSNRAHALYFLRAVAPTKLVDGAWLYGLVRHWRNARFSDLLRTYVEELGEGVADKNHVLLYRHLLSRHGLDLAEDLDEKFYAQGAIQLALACNAEDYLPEVIGFNLGYEQLPLHLLITAYELNELGIDPYYFTLHVTVDNADTGHARRAVQAVQDNLPRIGDAREFWRRVRVGYGLSNAGVGTVDAIEGFDIEAEVVRIFTRKSAAGHGAHSDYCRVAGRNVNDWLANRDAIPEFLRELQKAGWIKRGQPVGESRFWGLLQGSHAEMFGVFSSYELQVIHDWIRGDASSDGQAYTEITSQGGVRRRPSFRVASRMAAARGSMLGDVPHGGAVEMLDSDLQAFKERIAVESPEEKINLLVGAMSPSRHWTPAGLYATQQFFQLSFQP